MLLERYFGSRILTKYVPKSNKTSIFIYILFLINMVVVVKFLIFNICVKTQISILAVEFPLEIRIKIFCIRKV